MSSSLLKSLQWRRALKQFDKPKAPINLNAVLEAAQLAPSSYGVQPYKIIVVSDLSR